MKKIFIAGCGGMLGDAFYNHFKKNYKLLCTDKVVEDDWISFLDFRNFSEYKKQVIDFKPDYLFHLGAYTDLEYCENHPDDTYNTNLLSVENATHIANLLDIPLVFISTAGIFDGKKNLYDDWDQPNPLGHYARSKHCSEIFIQNNSKKYLILRAGWMMGGGPKKDKKFVNKIIKQLSMGVKEINIVNDKLGTPTFTKDFANNTDILLKSEYWGLYNLVCEGETGRLEVAKEIIKLLNYQDKVTINEVESSFFSIEYFAQRPFSERLINKKLNIRKLNHMRLWNVCLKEYLQESYLEYYNS